MYRFILKYRQVIINGVILTCLLLASMNFHSDFFVGVATGAGLIAFGESVGDLRIKRNANEVNEEKVPVINE